MKLEEAIKKKLESHFKPQELEIVNESGNHAVPENSETHFKVVIVSDAFQEKTRVQRHREIYMVLADELRSGVHALAIHAFTLQERQETKRRDLSSPPCSKTPVE